MADELTLTVRLHDPLEKVNHKLAASWVVIKVNRDDMWLEPSEFAAKYLLPAVAELEHFRVKGAV